MTRRSRWLRYQGETIHFEIVSMESSRALMDIAGGKKDSARQRHHHRQHRRAGLGTGGAGELNKGGDARAQHLAMLRIKRRLTRNLIMAENKKQAREEAKGPDKKANRRGAARLAAVQALYQMDIAGAGINDIFAEFESHWLGSEVEATNICRPKPLFSKMSLPASCATRQNSIP